METLTEYVLCRWENGCCADTRLRRASGRTWCRTRWSRCTSGCGTTARCPTPSPPSPRSDSRSRGHWRPWDRTINAPSTPRHTRSPKLPNKVRIWLTSIESGGSERWSLSLHPRPVAGERAHWGAFLTDVRPGKLQVLCKKYFWSYIPMQLHRKCTTVFHQYWTSKS